MTRDLNNCVIGGVCSGLANYLHLEPVLLRMLFLIGFLMFGSAAIIYIVLWICMPASNDPPRGTRPA